jgi:Kelch motif
VATPDAFALWEYGIASSSWKKHDNPTTSAGNNSEPGGVAIQGAAEGSGFSVKSLGQGWYFGGHLDFLTSSWWSIQTPRVYLKSFVEFTFPGYTNPGVDSLANNKTAGADGAWRNITNAGIQDQAGFTERADGLIVWVPGWGKDGILLSLGGGTNQSFSQMNSIDVFDVANSTWYRQATSGPTPKQRVNPCAVVAASADGSSYSVFMFGGQNLLPTGEQVQYSDMWILSVPSLIWIQVNTSSQSTPYPRAGMYFLGISFPKHSCGSGVLVWCHSC